MRFMLVLSQQFSQDLQRVLGKDLTGPEAEHNGEFIGRLFNRYAQLFSCYKSYAEYMQVLQTSLPDHIKSIMMKPLSRLNA